jgi:SAM-dependent methyltransferase
MDVQNPCDAGICCDLCQGQEFEQLHAWAVGDFWNPASIPIAVWKCRDCELVTLYPVPTAKQLPADGEWWTSERKFYRRRRWLKRIWEPTRVALFGSKESRLIRNTKRVVGQGRLLDIGCGLGQLMLEGKKHFDCVGLDPSPVAAAKIRELGFPCIEATFEDAEITPADFDAVVMDSVLEHVHSPTQVLEKVNYALRIGGTVAINVPKFDGPAYRRHGAGWNGFRHGYHTFLYTGQTLGKLLEKTGFTVLERPKRDRMLDDILTLWAVKVKDVGGVGTTQRNAQAA